MRRILLSLLAAAAAGACGGSGPNGTAAPPAATVQSPIPESQLARVTLSAEAEAHLALEVTTVSMQSVAPVRTVGAEAIVPPGQSVIVSAPLAGTLVAPAAGAAGIGSIAAGSVIMELLPLQQTDRDLQTEAARDAAEADARLTEATQRLERLEQLLTDGTASVRSVEEARANRAVASATADAARSRQSTVGRLPVGPRGEIALTAPFNGLITTLRASPGQTVAAGTPVAEIAQVGSLWLRVPVYAGDLASIDTARAASFSRLGQEDASTWTNIRRVTGPPAANPTAASVDIFFALPDAGANTAGFIRPGERVSVRLPLRSEERGLVIPQSAVVYDAGGGSWVYEAIGNHVFARRRVELATLMGSDVVVRRGLDEGTRIVTIGAAELFGTEFYVNR